MERLTEKRNGKNVIPLRNAICGDNLPYWALAKKNEHEQFISGDAADRLAAYEDIGTPEEFKAYKDTGLTPEAVIGFVDAFTGMLAAEIAEETGSANIPRIREIAQAEQEGRFVVLDDEIALAIMAGCYAIVNTKRLHGATYMYDFRGKNGGPRDIAFVRAAEVLDASVQKYQFTSEEAERALEVCGK